MRLHGDTICGCLPPCSDTWYEPEISYASFPGAGFTKTRTFKRLVARRNLSADTASDQYFKYIQIDSHFETEAAAPLGFTQFAA